MASLRHVGLENSDFPTYSHPPTQLLKNPLIRCYFPVASACGQPLGVSWSCHDIVAASSDADRSPLQLRWSGTCFQTPFGTQRWASTTWDRH